MRASASKEYGEAHRDRGGIEAESEDWRRFSHLMVTDGNNVEAVMIFGLRQQEEDTTLNSRSVAGVGGFIGCFR